MVEIFYQRYIGKFISDCGKFISDCRTFISDFVTLSAIALGSSLFTKKAREINF